MHIGLKTVGILLIDFAANLSEEILLEVPQWILAKSTAFCQPGILSKALLQKLRGKIAVIGVNVCAVFGADELSKGGRQHGILLRLLRRTAQPVQNNGQSRHFLPPKICDGVQSQAGLLILTAKELVRFLPPLTITQEDIDQGLAIFQQVLAQ